MRYQFRVDRLVSVGIVGPAQRRFPTTRGLRVAILMYHGISSKRDESRPPYYRTLTSPEAFAEHVDILASEQFEVISLSRALDVLRGGDALMSPRIPVVVTFDDGLRDFYTNAFRILEAAGIPATVFLTAGCIDGRFRTGEPCLRWEEVRELARYSVEFGSHTMSHPQLSTLSWAEIAAEVGDSKSRIEDSTGKAVTLFSYPYRFPETDRDFTSRLASCLAEQGYLGGVTTTIGRASPSDKPFFLKRLPINDCDDRDLFRAKLSGAYDWMHGVQLTFKRLRTRSKR